MIPEFYARNRKEWRDWLRKNHNKEYKVKLIFYKKHTGKPTMTTSEAMDEAICWGWIDTTMQKLDEERYCVNYSKRSEKSKWSDNTFARAEREIKARRMTKAGLEAYKDGKKRPTHDHGIPKNPKTPKYLLEALKKNKTALKNYTNLTPSQRKMFLRWLLRAKRQETIDKRVNTIVERMKENSKNI